MSNFKGFLFTVLTCFLGQASVWADSEYIKAYGKAYREYSRKISEAAQGGKSLSGQERRELHKTLFADANKAYVKEMSDLEKRITDKGTSLVKELNDKKEKMPKDKKKGIDKDFEQQLAQGEVKADEEKSPVKSQSKKSSDRKVSSVATATVISDPVGAEDVDYLKPASGLADPKFNEADQNNDSE